MNKKSFSKIKSKLPRDTYEQRMAQDNLILLCRVGSNMYGTNTKESDDDFVGIFIPEREYVCGLKSIRQVEIRTNPTGSGKRNQKEDIDITLKSLGEWCKLAQNNNPNILELFFAPENCIIYKNEYWDFLQAHKDLFLSLKIFHSFRGYAHSQRKRLELKSGRNTGRTDLIKKYGYDSKLASHNIRLYLECIQLLKEGKIAFPLPEREMLIQVKTGLWGGEEGFQKFLKESDRLTEVCHNLYSKSKLRYSPAQEEINKLVVDMFFDYWGYNKTKKWWEFWKKDNI